MAWYQTSFLLLIVAILFLAFDFSFHTISQSSQLYSIFLECSLHSHRPDFATAIRPIIGGALALSRGWRWIFWLLTILSGTCLLLFAVFFTETARSVIGDGSMESSDVHKPLYSYLHFRRSSSCLETPGNDRPRPEQEISCAKTFQFLQMFL
jgi:Major Facilitator Superfamily